MYRKISLLFGFLSIMLLTGVNLHAQDEITEKRDVKGFDEVGFSLPASLEIRQGDKEELIIKGSKEDLERIITKVENGKLKIRTEPGTIKRLDDVEIYLVVIDLHDLSISGSGNVKMVSEINTDECSIHLSGSGNLKAQNLVAEKLQVNVSGSGDVTLNGKVAGSLLIKLSGSGDIEAEGMEARQAEARISGSGSIDLWATDDLKANISGSGNIRYKGTPMVDARVSGSGRVSGLK